MQGEYQLHVRLKTIWRNSVADSRFVMSPKLLVSTRLHLGAACPLMLNPYGKPTCGSLVLTGAMAESLGVQTGHRYNHPDKRGTAISMEGHQFEQSEG